MSDRENALNYVFEEHGDLFSNNNDEAGNAVQVYLDACEAKDQEWQVRTAELVGAHRATVRIVEGILDRHTPESIANPSKNDGHLAMIELMHCYNRSLRALKSFTSGESPKQVMEKHNHITRDIKPLGQCPACDRYHDKHIPKAIKAIGKDRR